MKNTIFTFLILLMGSMSPLPGQDGGLNFGLLLDSGAGEILADSPLLPDTGFTIEVMFWNKETGTCGQENGRRILSWGQQQFEIAVCGSSISFFDGTDWIFTEEVLRERTWHHLAIVREVPAVVLYLDGEEVHRHDQRQKLPAGETFQVGDLMFKAKWVSKKWQGYLDELRMWSIPLTRERISQQKNFVLSGKEDHLLGYWNFDDGPGSSQLHDLSSQKNHARLKGFKRDATWVPGAPVLSQVAAQETSNLLKKVWRLYDQFDLDNFETGYLWNRGFLFDESLDRFRGIGQSAPVSAFSWGIIYDAVRNSRLRGTGEMVNLDSLKMLNPGQPSEVPVIPVGVINMQGEALLPGQVNGLQLQNPLPQCEFLRIFSASPFQSFGDEGEIGFFFSTELYFSNVDPVGNLNSPDYGGNIISVDLADGEGYREIDLSRPQVVVANYAEPGEYVIRFRTTIGEEVLESAAKFTVRHLSPFPQETTGTIEAPLTMDWKQFHGAARAPQPARKAYGDYYYVGGADQVLDKPVILVGGFDWTESKSAKDYFHEYGDLPDSLLQRGYDVFAVNFADDRRSLLENSNVLYQLIRDILEEKEGNFEGVIIGKGVGGIVARAVLAYLEAVDVDHQFGLFVSYDAPHKGANIPLGLQWLFHDAHSSLSPELMSMLWFNLGLAEGHPYLENSGDYFAAMYQMLGSEALLEILPRHYLVESEIKDTPGLSYRRMQTILDSIGYPELSRNIALLSGSNKGVFQGVEHGGQLVPDLTFALNQTLKVQMQSWLSAINQDDQPVARFSVGTTNERIRKRSFRNMPYSNAPGGYLQGDLAFNDLSFCFLPSVSAIDIYQTIINRPGFDFLKENEDYILYHKISPFDNIYADGENKPLGQYDLPGSGRTSRSILELENKELLTGQRYLQNRSIRRERDFYAPVILAGQEVQDRRIDQDFRMEPGEVVIEKDGVVHFRANDEVRLKPGFKAEAGSFFRASVDPVPEDEEDESRQEDSLNKR